jgi:hypothetical protein
MADPKPIEIGLLDSDLQPLKIGAEALAELRIVADRMVEACEVSGTSIDAMLETLKPRKVGPDDRIGVNLTAGEKKMLIGLADLDDAIKDQIRLVQPKQRLELTLRQINEIECALSRAMADMSDDKARRLWLSLDGKFLGIQTRHVRSDGPENSLGQILTGEPVSRGAAVREALIKMIEARRPKRKRPASAPYTPRQGQFLAFIDSYIRLHGQAPAERDIGVLLPSQPAGGASDGADAGEAGVHPAHSRHGPVDPAAHITGRTAGSGAAERTMKVFLAGVGDLGLMRSAEFTRH